METKPRDLDTIVKIAMDAITEKLDPIETALFFRYFNLGSGDYTKERHQWLDHLTPEEIISDIMKMREEKTS
jgi:hypothetical protein